MNIDHHSDRRTHNVEPTNLLHIIAQENQLEIFECLCTEARNHEQLRSVIKKMLNAFDANSSTPLHIAARYGHLDISKYLFEITNICENLSRGETVYDQNVHQNSDGQKCSSHSDKMNRRDTDSISNLSQIRSRAVSTSQCAPYMMAALDVAGRLLTGNNSIIRDMILKLNKHGCAPIHAAAEEGHKDIIELFICDAFARRHQILTAKNETGQTPLHLAALKGHTDIVEYILKHIHRNDITKIDSDGSTALHYAAQTAKKLQEKSKNILQKFIEAQKRWIKACQFSSEALIESLIVRNKVGYNCLEVAIINGNRPFINYVFSLEKCHWERLMKNAQITEKGKSVDTPMRKLIRYMPDIACKVLNKFVTTKPCINTPQGEENKEKPETSYDFQFLEDHCHVADWNAFKKYKPPLSSNKIQSLGNRLLSRIRRILFFDPETKGNMDPFTNDPAILVKNYPLSVIASYAALSKLDDTEKVKYQTRLLEHPLCRKLALLKWQQFGYLIFSISFFFYLLFVGLFTWATMRNVEPTKFYDAVNISYGNTHSIIDSGHCQMVFEQLDIRDSEQIAKLDHRKDTTDYALKYVLYILLWLHILKGILYVLGVYRFRIRGRFYTEVIALILCFVCLYDDPDWQRDTRLRCIGQWQAGSFGLFLAWSALLAYIRFVPYFGLYVVMLEVIIIKFLCFAPVLIILICSFAFSFHMLLKNQVPFSNIGFAWMRSAFMLLDMNYEGRFFDDSGLIVPYPVLFILFILYAVIIAILVANLLISLAVGEIPTLSQLARLHSLIIRNELLESCEIFRLRYFCRPSILYLRKKASFTESPIVVQSIPLGFKKFFVLV